MKNSFYVSILVLLSQVSGCSLFVDAAKQTIGATGAIVEAVMVDPLLPAYVRDNKDLCIYDNKIEASAFGVPEDQHVIISDGCLKKSENYEAPVLLTDTGMSVRVDLDEKSIIADLNRFYAKAAAENSIPVEEYKEGIEKITVTYIPEGGNPGGIEFKVFSKTEKFDDVLSKPISDDIVVKNKVSQIGNFSFMKQVVINHLKYGSSTPKEFNKQYYLEVKKGK